MDFLTYIQECNANALQAGRAAEAVARTARRALLAGLPADWYYAPPPVAVVSRAQVAPLVLLVAWVATERMRAEGGRMKQALVHPSSLILHPFARRKRCVPRAARAP